MVKHFDVEHEFAVDGRRCWRVIAEDIEAEYAPDALRAALGSEEWQAPHSYGLLHVVTSVPPGGRYRVVERRESHPWMTEFVVGTRVVLDITEAKDAEIAALAEAA